MVVMVVGKHEVCAAVVESTAVEAVHATAMKDRAGAAISASAVEHCTAVKSAAAMKTTASAMEATAAAMEAATTMAAPRSATAVSAVDFGDQRVRGGFCHRRCGIDW